MTDILVRIYVDEASLSHGKNISSAIDDLQVLSYNSFNIIFMYALGKFMTTKEKVTEANQAAAKAVFDKLGGPANSARKLTVLLRESDPEANTIRIGSIWSWQSRDKSGIPIKHILDFEKLSGIPREKIRPDVPWRGEVVGCNKTC